MAIKDLAVAYNASANANAALKMAVQMCKKYGAALTGLYARAPIRFEGNVQRWISDDIMESLRSAENETAKEIGQKFRDQASAEGMTGSIEFVSDEGLPNAVIARQARYHDLLLLGQFSDPSDAGRNVRAEDLVLRAGRPLLIVPVNYEVRPFEEYAVVAWDGSRPAARALSDAMQILETKRRIDVVSVTSGDGNGTKRVDNVITHLKKHGVDARAVPLKATREGVGGTILGYCTEQKPDILVMGAYGHAKLREDLFGGTTRHILEHMNVPVVMSH
ncbi:universal stress protein [Lutibaculum baratangense]|uniref:Universal stress protein UspA n=1 Tax=Lutibaculum baratangense AMV1 TaxID=631454 RepID=V4TLM8_9HYPH|nr:universal stress protein [Lutibaculum baratangense]ESR26708.1 Universal stress protein UspA [Lutibaculum baratangense AMV1]